MSAFRSAYPKDKVQITFDTAYRSSGTVTSPVYTLNEPLTRVGKILIDKVIFPCSYYVFNTGNNVLGSGINGGSITVPAGTYTQATLAAAVQTQLVAIGGGFAAATCTILNNIYTIATNSATTFSISASSLLAPILGFSSNKTGVTSCTSDFPAYENNIVINADNRAFQIQQGVTLYTFNILPGNYTGFTLALEIQNEILLQLSGYTVAFSFSNYSFTVSAGTSFTFKAAPVLGFPADLASTSNSVVSPNPCNIIGPTSVIIKSRAITTVRSTIVRTNQMYSDSIYEVLLNGASGDVIYDDPQERAELFIAISGGATFTSIDFRIVDDSGTLVNLGTIGRWKVCMIFETY